jgi:hypothetical protein
LSHKGISEKAPPCALKGKRRKYKGKGEGQKDFGFPLFIFVCFVVLGNKSRPFPLHILVNHTAAELYSRPWFSFSSKHLHTKEPYFGVLLSESQHYAGK